MTSATASTRFASLRPFLGVFVLNLLLAFPIAYQSYKQYDPRVAAWDTERYMSIVENGASPEIPPFRFRLLPSLVVDAMRPLPGYGIEVDFSQDPVAKRDFFHFVLLNAFLSVLVSALLFVHLRGKVGAGLAWLGSVLYLFSFYTITCGFIPMVDAACHLAILGGVMAFERRRPFLLAAICLVGVFAKETSVIVLIPWIVAYGLSAPRKLLYLLAMAPAVVAYIAAHALFPATFEYNYYQPTFMLGNALAIFRPSAYGLTGIFHVVLAQLPLIAAGAAWVWLRLRGGARSGYADAGLLLIPVLWWLGMTMDLWNNTGRFIFMAFPALILFQVRVIRELAERWGILPRDAAAPEA